MRQRFVARRKERDAICIVGMHATLVHVEMHATLVHVETTTWLLASGLADAGRREAEEGASQVDP